MGLAGKATFAEALAWARTELADSPTAALDARVLLEHTSGRDRAEMIASDREPLGAQLSSTFVELVKRRGVGEPVAYIIGHQEFYGRDFAVGPGVLIPRPESEMLVDAAVSRSPRTVLDLGTGSGALLLSVMAECPDATGVGIDASEEALHYAQKNQEALGLEDRAKLNLETFADFSPPTGEAFDIILANPPYIDPAAELPVSVAGFEPAIALFAKDAGLAAQHEVAAIIAKYLAPEGAAYIEIGHDQSASARAIYQEALPDRLVRTKRDTAGLPRMVAVEPNPGL